MTPDSGTAADSLPGASNPREHTAATGSRTRHNWRATLRRALTTPLAPLRSPVPAFTALPLPHAPGALLLPREAQRSRTAKTRPGKGASAAPGRRTRLLLIGRGGRGAFAIPRRIRARGRPRRLF